MGLNMIRSLAGALGLLFASAVSAQAATVNISTERVNWTVLTVESVTYFNFDTTRDNDGLTGIEEIRWGDVDDGAGDLQIPANQSGFRFDDVAPFIAPFNMAFDLGTFTHYNLPIEENTALETARLDLTYDVDIDGTSNTVIFSFNFALNETTNTGAGCCGDIVSISGIDTQEMIVVDGVIYQLDVIGFHQNNILTNQLISPENGNNSAILRAQLTIVPEPATWLLMIAGFAFLGFAARRRRAVAA